MITQLYVHDVVNVEMDDIKPLALNNSVRHLVVTQANGCAIHISLFAAHDAPGALDVVTKRGKGDA